MPEVVHMNANLAAVAAQLPEKQEIPEADWETDMGLFNAVGSDDERITWFMCRRWIVLSRFCLTHQIYSMYLWSWTENSPAYILVSYDKRYKNWGQKGLKVWHSASLSLFLSFVAVPVCGKITAENKITYWKRFCYNDRDIQEFLASSCCLLYLKDSDFFREWSSW